MRRPVGLVLLVLLELATRQALAYAPGSGRWEAALPAGWTASSSGGADGARFVSDRVPGAVIDVRAVSRSRALRNEDAEPLLNLELKALGNVPELKKLHVKPRAATGAGVVLEYAYAYRESAGAVILARSAWVSYPAGASHLWISCRGRSTRQQAAAFGRDFTAVVASLRVATPAPASPGVAATPAPSSAPSAAPSVVTSPVATSVRQDWRTFLDETIYPGKGIGKVAVGDAATPTIEREIGRTGVVDHIGRTENHYYARDFMQPDLTVCVADGKIVSLEAGPNFTGATDAGIRMGHSYADVLRNHGEPTKYKFPAKLVYADGTTFQFTRGKLSGVTIANLELLQRAPRAAPDAPQPAATDWEGRFQRLLKSCKDNALGAARVAQAMSPPALQQRIYKLDVPAYCDCFHEKLRSTLGAETAVRLNSDDTSERNAIGPEELIRSNNARDALRVECVDQHTR